MKTCISNESAIAPESRSATARPLAAATLACVALATAACASVEVASAPTPAAAGMVDIRSLVPDIALEMRYAGTENFVGRRVDGYDAPKCYLHKSVAEALRQVEQDLRGEGLRLKLFDCYRPRRAVLDFMRWAEDETDQRTKPQYYPEMEKSQLVGEYISPTSGHSRGATLDLTLMRCEADGRCEPLPMGTGFDYFGPVANTESPRITEAQRANRERLRQAMEKHGFENYPKEWWHYTFKPEPTPDTAFDFPVR
ncbi:M15 family metallopeptidase [Luteimonas sp. SX5]|uniref:D-alanyl-D-alanine dipeptidase n=1 Tax=Luteimonas galliterrae TaxID=2940486 RepID=A0ABT0MGE5_9GAMM|nr:M15 family metallopeptidase [Luteimonas galliterrae]